MAAGVLGRNPSSPGRTPSHVSPFYKFSLQESLLSIEREERDQVPVS
jgi:hypothetical protein